MVFNDPRPDFNPETGLTPANLQELFEHIDDPPDPTRFICPRCGNESYTVINRTHFCAGITCNGRARWHDTYWKDLTDYDEDFKPSFPKRKTATE